MTDPIADMLTRIRNAVQQRHQRVDVPASRFKAEIAKILEREGYISGYKTIEGDLRPRARQPAGPPRLPRT
jgi:small subunit ribosomal protein S8